MARVDDYRAAKQLAVERLSAESLADLSARTGFVPHDDTHFQLPFLDRQYVLSHPLFHFADRGQPEREIPLQEQVLILHYMVGADPQRRPGEMIAYREIPGASLYFGPFVKRAVNPLKHTFGRNLEAFHRACRRLQGTPIEAGDAAYRFQVFPQLTMHYILWEGDEEFEAEANILFCEATGDCLSPEDAAWMAGMVVYRLMALSRG